jgi:NAD(P)H-dependent flavin oxidoreductase YrpB (nitropropane dioxygenase family)
MLHTPLCDRLGIAYPIVLAGMGGVSMHELVAAVSNAGGLGVIGAATLDAEGLRREIHKTRELTSKPFAVDLLAPIPDMIRPQMQVVFDEGIKIFVAGLAVPREFIAEMHERGMIVIVMIGKVRHAIKSELAGADVVAAQGTEAGGHTGEIATMVLVPDVVDAVAPVPVLAAGGIARGRQVAAALALGAQGVWTGSVWLTTEEAETHPVVKEKFLAASAGDTVRSRSVTGKPARQLRSAWTDEWDAASSPGTLPMPLQPLLTETARRRIERAAHRGGSGAEQLVNYFVGQVVGSLDQVKPAKRVVAEMMEELADTIEHLGDEVATR